MAGYIDAEIYWENANGILDESQYQAIREVLAPEYRDLSRWQINEYVSQLLERMSPEEIEGFWQTLGNVAKQVGKVATQILPVAAPILGTALGGPLGGAIGSMVGQFVAPKGAPSQVPTAAPLQQPPGAVTTPAEPSPGTEPPVPAGGSSALAQILALIQNPAFLQSVLGQLLGKAGNSSVPVGGQQQESVAPFGAFMNALSSLATQAAMEANAKMAYEGAQETPRYLLDAEGNFLCDPAVPEQRAQVLLQRLRENYLNGATCHCKAPGDPLAEWFIESGLVGRN